mmetsp:Transcript_94448/g.147620  ORF Transcript_94448/g.147620 Transcript_94448/m.147620 type:complete len:289 (+) Transcript_94448:691-1557(+)
MPLDDIRANFFRQANTFFWLLTALYAGAPIPISLLDEPWHWLYFWSFWRRRVAHPLLINDHVRRRHQIRNKLVELSLVLQPDAAFNVHYDAAEIRLIGEVNATASEWTMADLTLSIFKPFLARINLPIRPLQKVIAKPLTMATNFAIGAIKNLSILVWLEFQAFCDRQAYDITAASLGNIIDRLPESNHLLVALLDLFFHDDLLRCCPSFLDVPRTQGLLESFSGMPGSLSVCLYNTWLTVDCNLLQKPGRLCNCMPGELNVHLPHLHMVLSYGRLQLVLSHQVFVLV